MWNLERANESEGLLCHTLKDPLPSRSSRSVVSPLYSHVSQHLDCDWLLDNPPAPPPSMSVRPLFQTPCLAWLRWGFPAYISSLWAAEALWIGPAAIWVPCCFPRKVAPCPSFRAQRTGTGRLRELENWAARPERISC